MNLSDAALRERLFAAFQAEALALVRQKALSREDCSALVSSFARIAATECAALRDAARAEAPPYNRLCDCGSGLMVRSCNLCVERAMTMARAEQREQDAKIAALFSVKDDRSIHPDVPWDEMNEAAKTIAHTTAQQIAAALRSQG